MRHAVILFIFLSLFCRNSLVWAQLQTEPEGSTQTSRPWEEWQQLLLENVDPEDFNERTYSQMLETLYELELNNHLDTLSSDSLHFHPQQSVIWSADQCLNQREGYRHPTIQKVKDNKVYLGNALHTSLRYDLRYRDHQGGQWRGGLTLDKDAGEKWQSRPPFYDSYHLYLSYSQRNGRWRQVLLGHYRVQLGLGLVIGQSFGLGKGMTSQMFFHKTPVLMPHSSLSETNRLLGAAARIRLTDHLEWTPFLSVLPTDGTLKKDTITSWATTGYHRTQREEAQRNTQWMTQAGSRLRWLGEWYEVSVNGLYTHLYRPFYRPLQTYNRQYFRGQDLWQGSVDYEAYWMHLHLKGEMAMSDNGGWAMLHGVSRSVADHWRITALYREYSRHYQQLWANALSESSSRQGERGETLLLEGEPLRHWRLQMWADWFQFSAPQYRIYQPSHGYELAARALYDGGRRLPWQFSVRYSLKKKYRNNTETKATTDIVPYYRQGIDAQALLTTRRGWRYKTRLSSRLFSVANESRPSGGLAVSQSVGWRDSHSPWRAEVQGTWFHTDNYDCRLYLSETNQLYGFQIPMLQGKGWRLAALVHYDWGETLTFEAKYTHAHYPGRTSLSSGLQTIRGNHQDNVWAVVRWRFHRPYKTQLTSD